SGKARVSRPPRAVAVEQLLLLSLPRDWTGAGEISGVADGDQEASGRDVWRGRECSPHSQHPTHSQRARMSGAPAASRAVLVDGHTSVLAYIWGQHDGRFAGRN